MKYIEVENCNTCPFRNNEFCVKTGSEIKTDGKFFEKYGFPRTCPLGNLPQKRTSEVSDLQRNLVIAAYNTYAQKLPQLPKLTITNASVKKYFPAIVRCKDVDRVISMVSQSDFLTGKISGWKADFDWIFKPGQKGSEWNVDKILSGKYLCGNAKTSAFEDKKRTYGEWK
jgi:hypothetical protein